MEMNQELEKELDEAAENAVETEEVLGEASENRGCKCPRAEEEVGSLQLAESSSQVNQQSHLLNDCPPHTL